MTAARDVDLRALVERWRAIASDLRGWGAMGVAQAVERCAYQLEAVITEGSDAPSRASP